MTREDPMSIIPFEGEYSNRVVFPPNEERLTLAQMIRGYTLNAAKQMRIDNKLGSIHTGKDAIFLIFERSLFDVDTYQLHKLLPKEVYIKGKLQSIVKLLLL